MKRRLYATPAMADSGSADRRLHDLLPDAGFAVRVRSGQKIGETGRQAGRRQHAERTERQSPASKAETLKDKKADDEGEFSRDVATDLLAKPANAPKTGCGGTPAPEQDPTPRATWRRPSR